MLRYVRVVQNNRAKFNQFTFLLFHKLGVTLPFDSGADNHLLAGDHSPVEGLRLISEIIKRITNISSPQMA